MVTRGVGKALNQMQLCCLFWVLQSLQKLSLLLWSPCGEWLLMQRPAPRCSRTCFYPSSSPLSLTLLKAESVGLQNPFLIISLSLLCPTTTPTSGRTLSPYPLREKVDKTRGSLVGVQNVPRSCVTEEAAYFGTFLQFYFC